MAKASDELFPANPAFPKYGSQGTNWNRVGIGHDREKRKPVASNTSQRAVAALAATG